MRKKMPGSLSAGAGKDKIEPKMYGFCAIGEPIDNDLQVGDGPCLNWEKKRRRPWMAFASDTDVPSDFLSQFRQGPSPTGTELNEFWAQ